MSTNQAVRNAWKTNVFDKFNVAFYDRLVLPESDRITSTIGYTDGALNHFQCMVTSAEVPMVSKQNDLLFKVQVLRIIEDDPEGDNLKTLADDFRTLINYVNDNLGTSWSNTVDLTVEFPSEVDQELIRWGSIPAWRGEMVFTALKQINA